MQLQQNATVVPPGSGKTVNVLGIGVDILLTGEDTDEAFSAYRVSVEPGDGVPPHIHRRDDETFYVLEGEFEVMCGGRVSTVTTGAIVLLPRDVPHTFRNVGTQTGHLLGVCTPAGHDRFFEDAGRLSFPPDPADAMEVCLRHDIELLPLIRGLETE
jgi:mannose-6-phosphate isomerase-like protein (cupin superfamily)